MIKHEKRVVEIIIKPEARSLHISKSFIDHTLVLLPFAHLTLVLICLPL